MNAKWAAVAIIVVVGLAVRLLLFSHKSGDYVGYIHPWFAFIRQHGGFHALAGTFSNYNVPYLYLLAAATYLPFPPLVTIKLISVVFDVVLAGYAAGLVRLRRPDGWAPIAAGGIVFLLPTVVTNGSMWGQSDQIYVAFAVAGLYYVLRNRNWTAAVFFGLALAFKLQAIFIFPVLALLVLRGRMPWRCLLAVPVTYAVLDVPALLLGADPGKLFSIYLAQGATTDPLRDTAPNLYQYAGGPPVTPAVQLVGLVVTLVVVVALIVAVAVARIGLTDERVLLAGTLSVLFVPFVLPSMRSDFFMMADVLTVVAAFWLPRRLWYPPVLIQFASFFAYLPFLLMPFRLRDLTGDASIANADGFVEPATRAAALLTPGTGPPGLLNRLLDPVIDYRVLATATLLALAGVGVATVRSMRAAR